MTENRRQILNMLSEGKISVAEAERLLTLLEQPPSGRPSGSGAGEGGKTPPKYLPYWSRKMASQAVNG